MRSGPWNSPLSMREDLDTATIHIFYNFGRPINWKLRKPVVIPSNSQASPPFVS